MLRILDAAQELQTFCLAQGWQFCFIGGLAVQRWGEPRLTQDADLTLLTGFGQEPPFIDALLAQFANRVPNATAFAMRYRVVLLKASNGVPLDISLGAMPFEEHCVTRATWHEVADGYRLLTCSAEDLIVHKAFANRDQDWLDIDGILTRQRGQIQWSLVWRELEPLAELKEDSNILLSLRSRQARLRS